MQGGQWIIDQSFTLSWKEKKTKENVLCILYNSISMEFLSCFLKGGGSNAFPVIKLIDSYQKMCRHIDLPSPNPISTSAQFIGLHIKTHHNWVLPLLQWPSEGEPSLVLESAEAMFDRNNSRIMFFSFSQHTCRSELKSLKISYQK